MHCDKNLSRKCFLFSSNLFLKRKEREIAPLFYYWNPLRVKEIHQLILNNRWTEDKDSVDTDADCMFKVDDCGFYIFWKSEGKEGDVLDISQVQTDFFCPQSFVNIFIMLQQRKCRNKMP